MRISDWSSDVCSSDLPSVTETFGNVTLEAMACGLPVVAARATGSASIVKHGQPGYLVAPGSITGFADHLQHYCRDTGLRAEHGAAEVLERGAYQWDAINQDRKSTRLHSSHSCASSHPSSA